MATKSVRNTRQILVGDDVGLTATSGADITDMNQGEIGIFQSNGKVREGDVSQGERFFFALYRTDGDAITTPYIDPNQTENDSFLTAESGNDAQEQITYVGHNPATSSGSIDALNDNHYYLRIRLQEFLTSNTDGRRIETAEYLSDSSATQEEVALNLADSVTKNVNHRHKAEEFIKAGAVNNGAVASANQDTFDNTPTFIKGSTKVAVNTNLQHGGTTITAGSYIRVSPSPGTTSGLTDHVYRVEEVDTSNNEITLDREFRHDSGNYTANGSDHQIFNSNATNTIGSDWGIKIEGLPQTFQVGKKQYEKTRWETDLLNGGSTDIVKEQAAQHGQGMGEEIAEIEWFSQGEHGEYMVVGQPAVFDKYQDANTNYRYDTLYIQGGPTHNIAFQDEKSLFQIQLATPSDESSGVASTPAYIDQNTTDGICRLLNILYDGNATSQRFNIQ